MSNTRKFTGRLVSWILIITFLTTSMLMLPQNAYAAGLGEDSYTSDVPSYIQPDELMNKIPHLGADPFNIPNPANGIVPGAPQGSSADGTDALPVAPGAILLPQPPPGEDPSKHPVAPANGAVRFEYIDMSLPGNGFDLNIKRSYSSAVTNIGSFGRGWSYNLHSYLRMYSEFDMTEFKADGSVITYKFVQDDPNGFVNSFDGDKLINYDLDKGHYQAASTGDTLKRISSEEYLVMHTDGSKTTYRGYIAPWRTGQPKWAGQLTIQSDRYGNRQIFTYDDMGKLTKINDTAGRDIKLTWAGEVITSLIGGGMTFTYAYDSGNHLTAVTNPDGQSISYTYDSSHRVASETDPTGGTTSYTYYDDGKTSGITNPLGIKTFAFTYSADTATVTDALGNARSYRINDKKLVTEETDPLGQITAYVYDEKERVIEVHSPQGKKLTEYDEKNRPVKQTEFDGGISLTEYDPTWGLPAKETAADSSTVSYKYDDKGNLTEKTDQSGNKSTYKYDLKGNLTEVIFNGKTSSFSYDGQGNLIKAVTAAGDETAYEYDGAGRLVAQTEPNGAVTQMLYDASGKLVKVTDPLNYESSYTYDASGRLLTMKNVNGETFTYVYRI